MGEKEEVVRHWRLLREGVAWYEPTSAHWLSFSGAKAAEAVNGLVTNDVAKLTVNGACYAAALTPKGKLVSDMLLLRDGEESLLSMSGASAFQGWHDTVRKYLNPRLARYQDETGQIATFIVAGPGAEALLGTAGKGHFLQHEVRVGGTDGWAMRIPVPGLPYCFLVTANSRDRTKMKASLASHATEALPEALQIVRIEAGVPLYGVDMNADTLAQEANMEELGAISFEKGCYTGQETVARVHFRGHVNRHIRGLLSKVVLPAGGEVFDENDKLVGTVTSSAESPAWGPVALGMLRRELTDGEEVFVKGEDTFAAVVSTLPFGGDGRSAA